MPSNPETTIPESGYGRKLRSHGLRQEADMMDQLILRGRECDAFCGPVHAMAEAWYRAEKEFDLPDEDPYEAIARLTTRVKELEHGN